MLTKQEAALVLKANYTIMNKQVYYWENDKVRDSLGLHLQRLEFLRDSLFRKVLPEEKFLLYKNKSYFLFKQ